MIVKIIICLVIPLLFFSIILKKEARLIMLFLCLGTFACYLAYLLNTYVLTTTDCTYFYLTSTIAPIVEELMKFIPIYLASILLKKHSEYLFQIAFSLGIGFAITENIYMLIENTASSGIDWLILRSISTGLMHAMSASILALGILKAKEHPELSVVGITASLFLTMIYHGFYNCLVNSENIMKYIGIIIPIITYTIIFIIYKKDAIKDLLMEK